MVEFAALLWTTNGPAPMGVWSYAFSPILLSAASSTTQFGAEPTKAWASAASLLLRFRIKVLPDDVMGFFTTAKFGKSIWAMGAARSRLRLQAASAAVSGVPSENVTPGRIVMSSWSPLWE